MRLRSRIAEVGFPKGGGHSYEKNVSKPKVAKSVSVRFKGVLHLKKDIQRKIQKVKLRRKEVDRD